MLLTFGTRLYGTVERTGTGYGDAFVSTRFFHILFLPVVPLATHVVLGADDGRESYRYIPARLSGRSVLAAYLRTWGLLGGIWAAFQAITAMADALAQGGGHDLLLAPLAVFAVGVVLTAAFTTLGQLDGSDKAERAAYARHVGVPVDVRLLVEGRAQLRARLEVLIRERALLLGLLGYRGADPGSAAHDPLALALSPLAHDDDLTVAALALARLDETERGLDRDRRAHAARCRAALVARLRPPAAPRRAADRAFARAA